MELIYSITCDVAIKSTDIPNVSKGKKTFDKKPDVPHIPYAVIVMSVIFIRRTTAIIYK